MAKTRPTRTDEELRTASERVYYCADQLLGLAEVMLAELQGRAQKSGPRCGNAHLESFLLNARSLLKFFDAANPYPDDVVVGDFFGPSDKWEPPAWSFVVDKYLVERANKELAHITYAPVRDESVERKVGRDRGEPWFFGAIATAFRERLGAFQAQVPQHRLGPSWCRLPGT